MELKFFNHFLATYSIVLGGVIGWFLLMFRKERKLVRRAREEQGR
ncbi:MAG: hypothetical protein ABIA75_06750 [Candidatus Neomarinimicrobiota bacterium]